VESRYIGCQRVDDPGHPAGPWRYYQTRFWARVELLPWDPRHEVDERRLIRPEDFLRTLSWGSAPSAAILLEEAGMIQVEKGYAGRRPRTWVRITHQGRTALAAELAALAELLRRHATADDA